MYKYIGGRKSTPPFFFPLTEPTGGEKNRKKENKNPRNVRS